MKIILASASPRRAELLGQMGLSYLQLPVDIDESWMPGETPVEHVTRLAREKAEAGAELALQQAIHLPVLAADTIIEIDGEILGKPTDKAHAVNILQKLSGRSHRVHTSLCFICRGIQTVALCSSTVEFARLTPDQIEHYVASGEPLDKAGAYAIQGFGGQFVKSLNGSYSGVMGLPLYETAQLLKTCESHSSL